MLVGAISTSNGCALVRGGKFLTQSDPHPIHVSCGLSLPDQWRTQDFSLGGAVYGQVKALNNKIKSFKILSNGFLKSRGCDRAKC